jgi:8-oxo-dGTP pyrophosphatase MutT (NUDIX family)
VRDAAGGIDAALFSADDFRRRAARQDRLQRVAEDDGDHRFNPGHERLIRTTPLRDAAVLIPVIDHGRDASVLLTKRAETLRAHTGQVAFPGGRIDPEDASPVETALREAEEEVGLSRLHVDVVGRMPDYVSGSGYRIAPVLAVVRQGFDLTINHDEVDAAFEVPLAFLMDPRNHARESRDFGGQSWVYYEMPYGGQRIWGVTAGIIRTLYERLYA